jgi:hypothetical protein
METQQIFFECKFLFLAVSYLCISRLPAWRSHSNVQSNLFLSYLFYVANPGPMCTQQLHSSPSDGGSRAHFRPSVSGRCRPHRAAPGSDSDGRLGSASILAHVAGLLHWWRESEGPGARGRVAAGVAKHPAVAHASAGGDEGVEGQSHGQTWEKGGRNEGVGWED